MSAPSLQLFPAPLPSLTPTTLRDVSTAGGDIGVSRTSVLNSSLRFGVRLPGLGGVTVQPLVLRPRRWCHHAQSVVLHRARRCWSGAPGLMSLVHPGRLTLWGRSRCSPSAILARRDLNLGTALGVLPLRPRAPCVRAALTQLTVQPRDLRTAVGTEPQEEGGTWSQPAGSSAS